MAVTPTQEDTSTREFVLVLIGIFCLTAAGIPGLLDNHHAVRGVLIGAGLVVSISGEYLLWRNSKRAEAQLARLQPRSLSAEQRRALHEKLGRGDKGRVGVCSRLMDGESADFAEHLESVFNEADWPIATHIKTSLNDLPGRVSLFVTGENLEARASCIRDALNEVGINCVPEHIADGSIGGAREPDAVYVVVGRKAT